jgi:hypothetical protein
MRDALRHRSYSPRSEARLGTIRFLLG